MTNSERIQDAGIIPGDEEFTDEERSFLDTLDQSDMDLILQQGAEPLRDIVNERYTINPNDSRFGALVGS